MVEFKIDHQTRPTRDLIPQPVSSTYLSTWPLDLKKTLLKLLKQSF